MAGIMDYHCPNCGGALAFDAASQKLKCPYCDSLFSPEEFQQKDDTLTEDSQADSTVSQTDEAAAYAAAGSGPNVELAPDNQTILQTGTQQAGGHTLTFDGSAQWGDAEDEDLRVYRCPNCGAQVIADATTAATHCPYCGNVVVMEGQLSGDFKPDYLIPFKVDKEKAVAGFKQYISSAKYVPRVFSAQDHPEDIKGVYVPFWLFDADVDVDAWFDAQNIRMWADNTYEYVETEYYDLHRAGTIAMRHVPVDGSRKMLDELMESIEPYDFKEAVPFQTAYLAGFLADRYDVGYSECTDRANNRMKTSAMESLRATTNKYERATIRSEQFDWKHAKITYALYPVWLLTTSWNGQNYLFAMNGQTGKFVGDLPLDKKAFARHRVIVCVILVIIFFVLITLGLLMM